MLRLLTSKRKLSRGNMPRRLVPPDLQMLGRLTLMDLSELSTAKAKKKFSRVLNYANSRDASGFRLRRTREQLPKQTNDSVRCPRLRLENETKIASRDQDSSA